MKAGLRIGLVGVMAALVVLPFVATQYRITQFLQLFMWIALAGSWNIMSGYTGYVSFGHVAFFGMGAYTAALLISKLGVNWLAASLAGGGMSVLLAVAIGWPCLRLKGPYFAIAMLGLNEVMRIIASSWESLTKGGTGITLPPVLNIVPLYFAMGLTALAVSVLSQVVVRSKFGLRLISIREDEIAAEAMGINTARHKLAAFMLSAVGPGVAGGLFADYTSYIDPVTVFPVLTTVTMIIMTLFGGQGTVLGPVLGTTSLYFIQDYFWARYPFLHQAFFGALIVGVVLYLPRGMLGLLRDRGWVPRGYR
jgi:branched-chain amino acid transport system permease protein